MAYLKRNWLYFVIVTCIFIAGSTAIFSFNTEKKKEANSLHISYTPASAANVMSRTLNSSYQASDQRSAIVSYNILITCTATLIAGQSGQVILETSPNNSVWTTISTGQHTVGSGLVFSGGVSVTVAGFVQRAYFIRLRSNNLVGTPTYGSPSGIEILIN